MTSPVISPLFGPLISPYDVERAALTTLSNWVPTYLYELERQRNLREGVLPAPPASDSYIGGLDFLSVIQDQMPMLVVTVTPNGTPELSNDAGYGQWYDVTVGAVVVVPEDEHATRRLAGYYGAAIQGAMIQGQVILPGLADAEHPDGLALDVRMSASPRNEWVADDIRVEVINSSTYQIYVPTLVLEYAGPDVPTPRDSPLRGDSPAEPWADWPEATDVDITVEAEPIPED